MRRKIWVAILAGFYPAIFFISNNWHIFSVQQSLVLLVGASLVSLIILFSISYVLDYILRKLNHGIFLKNASLNGRDFFLDSILTGCALIFCVFLLRNTLGSINIHKVSLYIIIATIVACFTWITHKKGLKPILYTLVILSSLSIANFFISVQTESELPIESWAIQNKAAYDQIQFRKTPNVYLIVTESYANKHALMAVYGIDNSSFYEKMREIGFKINHNHYSNYNHTLSSLPSLFSMEHHYGLIHIGSFDSIGGRRMLEAKAYNPVIDIFRDNNYKIQYLHEVSGLIPNGAKVDFCMPSPSFLHGLKVFLTKQNIIEPTLFGRKKSASLLSIKNQIAATSQERDPYFNFIYLNFPGHSPSRLKDRSKDVINQKLGKFRDAYSQKMASANQQLLELLNFIIGQDPDGIIVLIGDHGSWGFRTKEDTQGEPISNQLYILDRFGVLAGIRGPSELTDLMDKGTIKSHVNLFRYIFSYLSGDHTILLTKAADDSYDRPFTMAIKDGNILDAFIKVKLTKK